MRAASALIFAGILYSGFPSGATAQEAAPTTAPASDDVAGLISKLSSPDFRIRRDASSQLRDLGTAALPKLREASQAKDPEIRARANELVHVLEYQPVPGPLGQASRLRQRRVTYRIINGRQSVDVDDDGRKIAIAEGEDGIKMTVSGETNGQAATRTYTARTPEQLRTDNPEAFDLYQRYAHRGGDDDFDGAMGNAILQGNGNVLIMPRFQPVPMIPRRGVGEDLTGLRNNLDQEMDNAKLPPARRRDVRDAIDRVELTNHQNLNVAPGDQQDEQIARYEKACDDLRKTLADNHLPDPGDALPPPKSARLGVQIEPDPISGSLTVTHVLPQSRASHIGIQDNDIIRKINGKDVEDVKDLRRLVTETTKGLTLELTRNGKDLKLEEPK